MPKLHTDDSEINGDLDLAYGRAAMEAYEHQRNLARAAGYDIAPAKDLDLSKEMRALEAEAKRGMGYAERVTVGGISTGVVKSFAGSMRTIDIRTTRMPSQLRSDERVMYATHRAPAETNRLSANIITDSLVSQAGARVIITEPRPSAVFTSNPPPPPDTVTGDTGPKPAPPPVTRGVIGTYRDAGMFRLVETADFAYVADGAEVPDSAHPFFDVLIGMDESVSYAFRTKITRRQLKSIGGASTIDALTGAIARGLASLADRVLLGEIIAKTPTAFSLAKASARGLNFHELRALVGTTGAGAAVDNGRLYVSGVNAELTNATTQTIVGAFNRSAIAIHPIIQIHLERLNVHGEMSMTCWANMVPLVPDVSAFWTVGA